MCTDASGTRKMLAARVAAMVLVGASGACGHGDTVTDGDAEAMGTTIRALDRALVTRDRGAATALFANPVYTSTGAQSFPRDDVVSALFQYFTECAAGVEGPWLATGIAVVSLRTERAMFARTEQDDPLPADAVRVIVSFSPELQQRSATCRLSAGKHLMFVLSPDRPGGVWLIHAMNLPFFASPG